MEAALHIIADAVARLEDLADSLEDWDPERRIAVSELADELRVVADPPPEKPDADSAAGITEDEALAYLFKHHYDVTECWLVSSKPRSAKKASGIPQEFYLTKAKADDRAAELGAPFAVERWFLSCPRDAEPEGTNE